MVTLHIVYLRQGGVLLSRKVYADWREIQSEFEDFMASLGPWAEDEVVEFLTGEYPDLSPGAAEQVRVLVESGAEWAWLTWREPR